jgi:hypothetical protein
MKSIADTRFFRIGSVTYEHEPEALKFSNVSTFDASVYSNNQPKYSMIRESTSLRPHLVRNINLLSAAEQQWLQNFWNQADQYVHAIGQPYQCFLVITKNCHSVATHSHGSHLGDTVTVVSVQGSTPVSTKLIVEDHPALLYPGADDNFYAVCFDSNAQHSTESMDTNVYFHFVYDLVGPAAVPKNTWIRL